jgi:hypothetical protein
MKKVGRNIWATSVIKKLSGVNIHPVGENSPNLVTLMGRSELKEKKREIKSFFFSRDDVETVKTVIAAH